MEELAARQRIIEPSGGVLFARNADGEKKREARKLILDLFHPAVWAGRLDMLTMPRVHWRFERQLLALREEGWMRARSPRRTGLVGVENDRSIYFASCTQMPGVETPDRVIATVKRGKHQFAELAFKTRYASFFFADVDDCFRHSWQSGWDAAWLDYTGPLSVKRLELIAGFFRDFIRSTLIVTALKARWDKGTGAAIARAGGYSEWLRKHLPGEVLHDFEYMDTAPMVQFAVRHASSSAAGGVHDRPA